VYPTWLHIQALWIGLSGISAPDCWRSVCWLIGQRQETLDMHRLNEPFGVGKTPTFAPTICRLRHETQPSVTCWRVTIHVSSASTVNPHWASESHLLDTLLFTLFHVRCKSFYSRCKCQPPCNPYINGAGVNPPPTGHQPPAPTPCLLTPHAHSTSKNKDIHTLYAYTPPKNQKNRV